MRTDVVHDAKKAEGVRREAGGATANCASSDPAPVIANWNRGPCSIQARSTKAKGAFSSESRPLNPTRNADPRDAPPVGIGDVDPALDDHKDRLFVLAMRH